jgi:uncharacterized phage protein gp47/JayE
MSSFGVLPTGFVAKSLEDIKGGIEAAERAAFGDQINTEADSVFANLNAPFAAEMASAWEALEAVYSSLDPDQANGAAQDATAAITGSLRKPATHSTATLAVNLAAGTQLLPGRIVSDVIGNRFVTTELVENTEAYAQTLTVEAEAEEFGPIFVAAHGLVNIETPVSGWSEAAAITSGNAETYTLSNGQTLTVEVDGGAVQTATFETGDFVDIGNALAAEIAAVISADITGATASDENGSVRIVSDNADGETSSLEVTGGTANAALGFATDLIAGMNPLDADPGEDLEDDADFRARREDELRAQGEATVEAILADMLDVEGVDAAVVFENDTDFTDGDGRPPHSNEVIILGDDPDTDLDDRVGAALFATNGGGIQTHREAGAQGRTVTVTDSQGVDHDMNFNRASKVTIWIIIDADVISDDYAGDGAVKAALVAQGAGYTIGEDVVAEANKAAAFGVNGVYDITNYKIGIVDPPTLGANIPIGIREIAEFDTARITVNSTPVVPG